MTALRLLSFLVLTVALHALPLAAADDLFTEDFSKNLAAWEGNVSDSVKGGRLVLSPGEKGHQRAWVAGGENWADVLIDFDVKIRRLQAAWTIRQSDGRYYMFILRGPVLSRFVVWDGTLHAGDVPLETPVEVGQPVHVRVETRGSVIRHYIDGQLVDEWTDDQLSAGTFGFRQNAGDSAAFDNVVVKAAPARAASKPEARRSSPTALASIPYCTSPPDIDGRISDGEWDNAAVLGGFSDLTGSLSDRDTRVRAMWDDDRLYLAFESPKRFKRNIPKLARDATEIIRDDAIEINLLPGSSRFWYKLAFNPVGAMWDARYKGRDADIEWNCNWTVRNHLIHDDLFVEDVWQAEVTVAWSQLNVDPPTHGTTWRAQFCRDYDNVRKLDYPVTRRWTSWSPATGGGFNHPGTFGALRFVRGAPALQFGGYASADEGHTALSLRGHIIGRGADPQLSMQVHHAGGDRKLLMDWQQTLDVGAAFDIERNVAVEEVTDVTLQWEVAGQKPIARGTARVTLAPAFAVRFVPTPTTGKVWIDGDISGVPNRSDNWQVVAALISAQDRVLAKARKPLGSDETFRMAVDVAGVEPGNYRIAAQLQDTRGNRIADANRPINLPPEQDWQKVQTGVIAGVPAPWTAVRAVEDDQAVRIETHAKRYTFTDGLLPDAVDLRGETFFVEPPRLIVDLGNGPQALRPGPAAMSEQTERGVTLTWTGRDEDIGIAAQARVEFDGLIWYDIVLQPNAGRELRDVWLELPLKRSGLRYMRGRNSMNFLKGEWVTALIAEGKLDRAYPEPAERGEFSAQGWRWPNFFSNFLWVGGVDRGLFTLLPSPRLLPEAGPFNAVEEHDDHVLVRVRLAGGEAAAAAEKLELKFGLLGTPSRPLTRRDQMNRTGFNNIPSFDPESLDLYLGRMDGRLRDKYFTGPNLIVNKGDLFAGVVRGGLLNDLGYPVLDKAARERLSQQRKVHQDLGSKSVLWCDLTYTPISYKQGAIYAPEWEQYPRQRHLADGEYFTLVCPAGSWADFYLYHIDRLMRTDDIHGVYLDMTGPGSCNNPYHGCGYERDGKRHGEIPILALRELFLRLYQTVHANDPEGVVFYHSQVFTPFSLYADVGTRGENWAGAKDYRTFSLPYYQAAYMVQHQYGVPFNFFSTHNYPSYRSSPEEVCTLSEVVGLSLLHDTLPSLLNSQQTPGLVTVWNALHDFGAYDDATVWTPYWKSKLGDWQNGVAVSTYRNTKGETFVVAFNPSFDDDHNLRFDLASLGAHRMTDIITGESAQVSAANLTIAPRDIALLLLR